MERINIGKLPGAKRKKKAYISSIEGKGIYLSAGLTELLGLEHGDRICFFDTKDGVYISKTGHDDEEKTIEVKACNKTSQALRVSNAPLTYWLKDEFGALQGKTKVNVSSSPEALKEHGGYYLYRLKE